MISYRLRSHHHHHHHAATLLIIIGVCVGTAMAAVLPASHVALIDDSDYYSSIPNDIFPIQPVLVYPKSRNSLPYQGRNLLRDNDIIYVKLLDRKSYRPRKLQHLDDGDHELQMKDIFYVKAVANGQFSTNRLKVYRLPEFYAINVYKKGELSE